VQKNVGAQYNTSVQKADGSKRTTMNRFVGGEGN